MAFPQPYTPDPSRYTDAKFRRCGKSGIDHDVKLHDHRIAKALHACLELPGQELFGQTDRRCWPTTSGQQCVLEAHALKDFRTWRQPLLRVVARCRSPNW